MAGRGKTSDNAARAAAESKTSSETIDPVEVPGTSKWLNGAATTSALASAIAAICALVVSCQERSTPYKTAIFTARWDAIKEYEGASTALQQELTRLQESMPIEIGKTTGIAGLSDAQINDIAEEAYKIYPLAALS